MNPLDNLVPPDLLAEDDFLQEYEEQLLLLSRQNRLRQIRANRERERRRRQMAQMDQEVSSDSEVEKLNEGVKEGKMDVTNTPAGSTPQELVKLDP